MRLPNNYGSIYKLSGNRYRPWCVRKTVGWKKVDGKRDQPVYQYVGYYETKADALAALAEFNASPYDVKNSITFEQLYDRWSDEHFEEISQSNINGCRAAYKLCERLYKKRVNDLKLDDFQRVVDESGKNSPTLRKLKVLLSQMYTYGVIHELCLPEKRDLIKFINIKKAGNPNQLTRTPFTVEEIHGLVEKIADPYAMAVLMLIYSGLRVGELLELRSEDVHIDERYAFIRKSKTTAGVREVPIHEEMACLWDWWLDRGDEYLITTPEHQKMNYRNFKDAYFGPLCPGHLPHDTRHTTVSILVSKGVDERIIKAIVGHQGYTVTDIVYTHLDLPLKIEAINKIPVY